MSKPINKINYKPLRESLTPFESEVNQRDGGTADDVVTVLDPGAAEALKSHYRALEDTKNDIKAAYAAENVQAFLNQTATEGSRTKNFDVVDRFALKKLISENRKPGVTFSVKRNFNPNYRYQLTLTESSAPTTEEALEITNGLIKKITDAFPGEVAIKANGDPAPWFDKLSALRKAGIPFDTITSLIDDACKAKDLASFISSADALLGSTEGGSDLLLDNSCSKIEEGKEEIETSTNETSATIEREVVGYLNRTTLDLMNYITEQLNAGTLSSEVAVVLESIRGNIALAWGKIQTCITETAPEEVRADITQGVESAQDTFSEGTDLSTDVK